jgi:Uncharacterized conserved protein
MFNSELLKILCCPETRQELRLAGSELMESLNRRITEGTLRNRAGRAVTEKLDGGLLRTDGKFLYPIRQDIPVMLVDEAIPSDGSVLR